MANSRRLRLTALLVVLTFIGLGAATGIESAGAAQRPGTGRPDGYGYGYNNVIEGKGAFQRFLRIGTGRVAAYSVRYNASVDMNESTLYTATTRDRSGVSQIESAADLASRSSQIGEPLSDANAEAAAVQLAIWVLTDKVDLTGVGMINAPVKARADELARLAGSTGPAEAAQASMTVTTKSSTDGYRVTVQISDGRSALRGRAVTIVADDTRLEVRTNDDGVAVAKLPSSLSGETMTVTFAWSMPAGTVLVPAAGAALITTEAATLTGSYRSTLNLRQPMPAITSARPTVEPSPTATPAAKPTVKPTLKATGSPSPKASPTMAPGDESDIVDPASAVIDFSEDSTGTGETLAPEPATTPGQSQRSAALPVAVALLVFIVAAFVARRRLRS